MELINKRAPSGAELSSEWTDEGLKTAEMSIKKPINILRTMFSGVRTLMAGDQMVVRLEPKNGGPVETPTFDIDRAIEVDSITKFEVIDEFDVDVGIGFVLGKAKARA